jgi:hypothetical protein
VGNDTPGYKWAERNLIKRVELETGWGTRATELRTRKDKVNAFGDDTAAKVAAAEANRTAAPSTERVQRTATGSRMTPELIAAKAAFEQSRADAKAGKAQVAKLTEFDQQTSEAIAQSWMLGTPSFYASQFNVENLHNKMLEVLYTSSTPFGIPLFNACFKWMNENGYMERKNRIRGEAAAKVYPVFDRTPILLPTTAQQPTYVITPEERSELKKLPLDELARRAHANYKKA